MNEIVRLPLARISPYGEGRITALADSVALVTDSRQWAYSAEAHFDIPEIENESSIVNICVEVESGVLGVGLLREDGTGWEVRASASEGPAKELSLPIPVQARRGRLVFDNWTEGGNPARGVIRAIRIIRNVPATVAGDERESRDGAFSIPLTQILPRGESRMTTRADSVALVTDPRQWAYSAEAHFDIPEIEDESRLLNICVEVESGVLGVGLLREDGTGCRSG
jgi:hypothetical protein